jgi:hypothetical protein
MRAGPFVAALGTCWALTGCAGSSPFTPTPVSSAGMPYAGLNEASYGARATSQFKACDPASGSSRLAAVTAVAARPVQGLMKIDSAVQSLGLSGAFTDPLGSDHPPVAVLSHGAEGIVFWHTVPQVPPAEVAAAARAWCSGQRRGMLYRGSASHCPAARRGLAGAPVVPTYAISAYACTGRP